MTNNQLNNLLHDAIMDTADASDRIVPGSGRHYRGFAQREYGARHEFLEYPRGKFPNPTDSIGKCWEVVNMFYCGQTRDAEIHKVLTGVHDSATCVLGEGGKPCAQCVEASQWEHRREQDEHALDVAMADYITSHGQEAFARKVDRFMAEKEIW
jgi:hypothetical protein